MTDIYESFHFLYADHENQTHFLHHPTWEVKSGVFERKMDNSDLNSIFLLESTSSIQKWYILIFSLHNVVELTEIRDLKQIYMYFSDFFSDFKESWSYFWRIFPLPIQSMNIWLFRAKYYIKPPKNVLYHNCIIQHE